jgi:hypothetical protein
MVRSGQCGVVVLCAWVLLTAGLARPASAQGNSDWTQPFPPFRIADNLYYVGSKGLANYLVTTPEGHILINSDLEANVPLIQASIEKLGFKFSDVKPCDYFLGAHGAYFDMEAKYKRITGGDRSAFVDRDGYKKFVADKEQEFRAELAKQEAARGGR